MSRFDTRSEKEFKKDIYFATNLEKYFFEQWLLAVSKRSDILVENPKDNGVDNTGKFIEKGKGQNIFRPEINVELATIILFEQLQMLMENSEKIFSMHYFSPAEVFEHISINFIRGMATKEGVELIDHYYNEHQLTN